MEALFVDRMKLRLYDEQASLQAEAARLRADLDIDEEQSEHAGLGNHMADDATDLFEQEKNLALLENTSTLLFQVESALRRVDQGTYGACDCCGALIDRARLETRPYASLCVTCKTRQEKG